MQPLWKTVWRFFKKLKNLKYDPAIPLLSVYPNKTQTWKDICTPMFIAALFTIAKIWKQPKCPSVHEWIKMWHTHTHTHQNIISYKKELNLAICNNMDGPWGHYAKWNKTDRERQLPYNFTYTWNLKNKRTNKTKQKQTHR